MIAVLGLIWIYSIAPVKVFLTPRTCQIDDPCPYRVIAVRMLMVIVSGNIDLSVGGGLPAA